jgi:hypothetical protein
MKNIHIEIRGRTCYNYVISEGLFWTDSMEAQSKLLKEEEPCIKDLRN